ncbi:tail fiber domain-containing protein [Dyadobacter endophyticus]|nr:tail fiber domain-containing protein [Dyadobacter endophyticus]
MNKFFLNPPCDLRHMRKLALALFAMLPVAGHAQVGVGTQQPQEMLHIHDGSILSTSVRLKPEFNPYYDPAFPDSVEHKMKWFHDKAAFRSLGERVGNSGLDPQTIGNYSFASGFEVFAIGVGSAAFGLRTNSSGKAAFASGENTAASGNYSFAHGVAATASGDNSVALGNMVSTDSKEGSFVFGDNSKSVILKSNLENQMSMRFAGGYRFYSNSNQTIGISLASGGNSWQVLSDVNRKENFSPINGEAFLGKIRDMKLTSWNYKGQDPKTFRHYGPMAQDFFHAFGQDAYGTIGNDTTINQADFDGVNLIAIQALVKRTDHLRQRNEDLRAEIAGIKSQLALTRPKRSRALVSRK